MNVDNSSLTTSFGRYFSKKIGYNNALNEPVELLRVNTIIHTNDLNDVICM